MIDVNIPKFSKKYRYIFIVDTFSQWESFEKNYDHQQDLVLTFDFSLCKKISNIGDCFYIDHLICQERMEKNNYLIYKFFQNWHNDKNGNDIFNFKGVDFGMSFRLNFWNDYTYYLRLYLCLSELKNCNFEQLFLLSIDNVVKNVLEILDIHFDVRLGMEKAIDGFYFPIAKYMDDNLRPSGFRGWLFKIRRFITNMYGALLLWLDSFCSNNNKLIFIQEYHPTKKLIKKLKEQNGINVLLCHFSKNEKYIENLKERLLPLWSKESKYKNEVDIQLSRFLEKKHHELILDNGKDVTKIVYDIIFRRIKLSIGNKLCTLNDSISYFDNNPVNLSVIIANIGETATLFDLTCKSRGVPSYLIINGLLGSYYSDESKYASYINSYSESIKNEYFKGMNNIVVLGDPRMDDYAFAKKNVINRITPTIIIGASGFDPIDLNSYVAIEFDFMFDVLSGIKKSIENGLNAKIIIKVRPNGYEQQYRHFVEEYFPKLNILIMSSTPMKKVLDKADLYISIHSQTLFEASCLGIPVIYYKKDNEILPPPFDRKSELITISTIEGLVNAIDDFTNGSSRFDLFLKKEIMEKYVGMLDGNNLQRNFKYISNIIE